jgi:ring-1,2-phenylacetyl-CoA epoxidase subunit PaaE
MMSGRAGTSTSPVTVTRIPDPGEPVPRLSAPGVVLLLAGLGLWSGSSALVLTHQWPLYVSVPFNAIASYMLFTTAHDASHHSLSSIEAVNVWIGRVAALFFAPHAGFRTWRFIHMQHHRFTNHDDGRDPDHYTNRGPSWQKLLRWLTIDLYYMVFYVPKLRTRPRRERVELAVTWLIVGGFSAAAIITGHALELFVLYYLPIRLAIIWLGFAFDYLPHNGLHHRPTEDRFKTTRNRIGLERLVSPLLLYQNYHLVHHLHPIVPFHKYIVVWRRNEEDYLAGEPALSDLRGRPITVDEYRRLRELAHHHH